MQLTQFLNELAKVNVNDLWTAFVTASPYQLSPFMEAIKKVKYVAAVYVLFWKKKTATNAEIPSAGGLTLVSDCEHVIQVLIDARDRLGASGQAPVVSADHFPFFKMAYLKRHPRFSPDVMRHCVFEAPYCAGSEKMKKDGEVINMSEKPVGLGIALVRILQSCLCNFCYLI